MKSKAKRNFKQKNLAISSAENFLVNSRARMLNYMPNCYTVSHMNQFVASMDAY